MVSTKRNHGSLLGIEIHTNINNKKHIKEEKVVIDIIQVITPYLNEDIVAEILVKIPADLLYNKFRYVCKAWFNIITNPTTTFVQRNLLCSEPCLIFHGFAQTDIIIRDKKFDIKTYLIKLEEENINQEQDLSTLFKDFTVDGCCNGLLLLTSNENTTHHYVANLVTKQSVKLPPCSLIGRPQFVFVPSMGVYKIMIPMIEVWSHQFNGYEILTLGEEDLRWRRVEAPSIQLHYTRYRPRIVNGVSHMFEFPSRIASFDVSTEEFYLTTLPDFGWINCGAGFVEMGKSLAFVNPSSRNQLGVWILKDFRTGEWIKQHSIRTNISKHFNREIAVPVMGFGNSDIIVFGSTSTTACLRAYNVKLQRWWNMETKVTTGITSFFGSHTNSLVSLKALIQRKQTA